MGDDHVIITHLLHLILMDSGHTVRIVSCFQMVYVSFSHLHLIALIVLSPQVRKCSDEHWKQKSVE